MTNRPLSFLQQTDPRLKLILIPLLIAATFSGDTVVRLLILSGIATWLSLTLGEGFQLWWRVVRPMKILLLVTLVMHLCFSSGWTIFGQTWLSLDGLQLGLMTCWRLIVAVLFAMLLSRSTPIEELAVAFGSLMSPLKRIGLPVDKLTEFLLLTLLFIPTLQAEGGEKFSGGTVGQGKMRLMERLGGIVGKVELMILGFSDRADSLAINMSQGKQVVDILPSGPLKPIHGGWFMTVLVLVAILLLFSI